MVGCHFRRLVYEVGKWYLSCYRKNASARPWSLWLTKNYLKWLFSSLDVKIDSLLMNYMSTTHIIGVSKLRLLYSDEDLNSLISEFIADTNEFTFSQLCSHILYIAEQKGKLEKAPYTTYSHISLTPGDNLRITRMIWERIWSKEIFMLFSSLEDKYHRSDETYLIVNK